MENCQRPFNFKNWILLNLCIAFIVKSFATFTIKSTKHRQFAIHQKLCNKDIKSIRINFRIYWKIASLIKWNFMTFPNVSCDTARLHKADATQDFAHSIRCTRYAFCLLRNSSWRICCCTCAKPSSQIIDKASNYTQFREDAGVHCTEFGCANSVFLLCLRLKSQHIFGRKGIVSHVA